MAVLNRDSRLCMRICALHVEQGKTYGEIADAFGMTRGTVAGIIRRYKPDFIETYTEQKSIN